MEKSFSQALQGLIMKDMSPLRLTRPECQVVQSTAETTTAIPFVHSHQQKPAVWYSQSMLATV